MKTGLYALASLDGSPLHRGDRSILGLDSPREGNAHYAALAIDGEMDGRAITQISSGPEVLHFLGHLDEPECLAARLQAEHETSPAALALRALHKWGPAAALAHMPGEWSLLHWDAQKHTLLAGVSRNLRDPMRFAANGRHVAIGPDVRQLGTLSWTDLAFNPAGLALWTARMPLRHRYLKDQTILRHVTAIEPGTFRRFAAGKAAEIFSPPHVATLPPWTGSFEDAVQAVEKTARKVVRETLARHGTVAIFLSGGLDSSTLAWLAAQERRPGQNLFCITSVAPPGSGLPDERTYSKMVADTLGLPILFVTPEVTADPYRPSPATFSHADGPSLSPRHYLYETLLGAARSGGAGAVLDGLWGELNLTRSAGLFSPGAWLKDQLRPLRDYIRPHSRERASWPDAGFHVRFSQNASANLPNYIREKRLTAPSPERLTPDETLGMALGHEAAQKETTASQITGLRHLIPYRDDRLISLMATFPAGFTVQGNSTRAIARAILKDRLPDAIRLRTKPVPFSPDYDLRLQRDAGRALKKIDMYRTSEAAAWIDLSWLHKRLAEVSCSPARRTAGQFKLQCTAMMAEFLVRWENTSAP
jgi:asparagine synthase (glutamine-hydrolysing)